MKSRTKYPRNDQCPCGSGKKYKNCCLSKGIRYTVDTDGVVCEAIQLDPQVIEALEKQREKFVATFGREPGPNDPVFFDLVGKEEEMSNQVAEYMTRSGIDPAMIYAYRKTGLMVTEMNIDKMSDVKLKEWQDAIDEYSEIH
ncbi:MAG TPA: SEC-C metal-binding domain-containing protein [Spirochaetia bacterium]|nr:SEC-C metal-binding domain-containing protein [Spirochaetia bacterium]